MRTCIKHAQIILPESILEDGWLLIEDERIAAFGHGSTTPEAEMIIDAAGRYLMPGIIDLHSDIIEKQVQPRPGVFIDLGVAYLVTDRMLAGAGVTTEFHAVSLDDQEFGVRNERFFQETLAAIHARPIMAVRHLVHARVEITSVNGPLALENLVHDPAVQLVSIMDHSPGQGQYTTEEAYRAYAIRTSGFPPERVEEMIAFKKTQRHLIPNRIEQVARLAREAQRALATHDDDDPARIADWPGLGVTISEFPTTLPAARAAHEAGLVVCMGAPNVLRGVSSGGNLSALEAIEAGVVDCLCADYYPAALLPAAFKVARLGMLSLPRAIGMITAGPARGARLEDRGRIAEGCLADVILVEQKENEQPRVCQVWVSGEQTAKLAG